MSDITSEAVLEIVQEVLERNERIPATPLHPDDDLYDLGFESLTVMQVAARVQERLGVEPPLSAYFDAGTVGDLVTVIAAAQRSTVEPTP